jgi:tetratricopeptide (TPR) repeat protein
MTSFQSQTGVGLKDILLALDEFVRFDLGRPHSASLNEYLQFLVDESLLSAEASQAVAGVYLSSRFGGASPSPAELAIALDGLTAAVQIVQSADPERRRAWADRLQRRFAALELCTTRPADSAAIQTPSFPADCRAPATMVEPGFTAPNDLPSRRRWSSPWWLTSAVLLWTLAVLSVGYMKHAEIGAAIATAKRHFGRSGEWEESSQRIADLRQSIAASPRIRKPAHLLLDLAHEHWQRDEYAEAIVLYQRVIAAAPTHAGAQNNLAWLLLTADDPWYRDPAQALSLAERAYELQPAPAIIDTLAEACYQTGDYARAVALQEEALAMNPADREFFEARLQKFRKALDESRKETELARQGVQ